MLTSMHRPTGIAWLVASGLAMIAVTYAPPALDPQMPRKDAPGGDVPGLPRFPGSVRTEYVQKDLGGS
jgi:hypothetical protein